MTNFIPIFTAFAGLVAAIVVLFKKDVSQEIPVEAGIDPEAAADRGVRLSMTRWLAFSSLLAATLICLTVQLGILVNRKVPDPVEPAPTSGDSNNRKTANPSVAPPATGAGTKPSD